MPTPKNSKTIPPTVLRKALAHNARAFVPSFAILEPKGNLTLNSPVLNTRRVSPVTLRKLIDNHIEVAGSTSEIWDPAKWPEVD